MKKLLICGFGRMGVSHTFQILGLLGHRNVRVYVYDTSLISRMIAKFLLPKSVPLKRIPTGNKFDFCIICTPPSAREDVITKVNAEKILIEKPVMLKLRKGQSSGYVMQHTDIHRYLRSKYVLSPSDVKQMIVKIETQVDFSKVKNWRSSGDNALYDEYFGHSVTFGLSVFSEVKAVTKVETVICEKNMFQIKIEADGMPVTILLKGAQAVRKARYSCEIETNDLHITTSPYVLHVTTARKNKDLEKLTLPDIAGSIDFFLRSYEFERQSKKFLFGRGDILSGDVISQIESIRP